MVQFDKDKLHATILYVCSKCAPSDLGAVKLHKVLYYADMFHYLSEGHPITGSVYRKRPFGPTCDQLLPGLRELANQNKIEIREVDFFSYKKKEYHVIGTPDVSRLSLNEQSFIDAVMKVVCEDNSAKSISEISHTAVWQAAEMGEILPYSSAYHIFPNQVSVETFELAAGEVETIASERMRSNPLEFKSFSSLRSSLLPKSR